ncbi:MAG: ATP-binding protein [Candidatus Omnitrophica bacterium]|nr:ATP-binding protein [Candidatus Omnitrophota bacterium]MBU4457663.1 ATP-binding protein [Candidatus Omnitrophota bacterium]
MIISIASGKGGTGKTIVATSLGLSIDKGVQFLDCDVEEPNAHIFLKPKIEQSRIVSIPVPKIDESKCTFCGRCSEVCAYNAIAVLKDSVLTFPHLCHGCGGCMLLCPQKAIREIDKEIGIVEIGNVNNAQFIHGRLNIGEVMSPPLIRAVKDYINPTRTVIIDAPPGTSCPVIETVKGSDFCILVTEPTPFGLNDLILAVEVLRKLDIPFGIVINRSDIGDDKLNNYCKRENIYILMQIPFRKEIAFAYSKGMPIVEALPELKKEFIVLYKKIIERIK